jgi:aldose 1-epimerase
MADCSNRIASSTRYTSAVDPESYAKEATMSVFALDFGTTHTGSPTHLYRMKNANGMEVDVTDLGACVVAVRVPDRDGKLVDVALGYDEVAQYEHNKRVLGGIVGRCANRIAGAAFELDGRTYRLTANEGQNTLHGGRDMWFERLWDGAIIGKKGDRRKGASADTVIFGLLSPDGDQGFPGELDVRVTYRLTDQNELKITYDAQPGLQTIVNLTNHTYWNLNGHDSGSVLGHTLQVVAERYTPTDAGLIPTGTKVSVAGTPFDFRAPKRLDRDLSEGLNNYDQNFLLGCNGHVEQVATLVGDKSGIRMTLHTSTPALQVYTGLHLDVENGKAGASYGSYAGIALETQFTPDAINHPEFRQPIFSPEYPFHSRTTYAFDLA